MEAFKFSHSAAREMQLRHESRYSLAEMRLVEGEEGKEEVGVELRVVVGRELLGEELFKYHWRRSCKENVVRVYSAVKGENDTSGVEIIVKCEKVEVGDVETTKNLTLGQMLYFAKTMIKTSLFLSKTFGYFSICPKMIGVNRKGEFKLWINQNFAENSRQYPLSSQSQFIDNLIWFVQDSVKENKLFQLYLRKLAENMACLKEAQDYEEFHCGFLRLHWIKQAERIEMKYVEKEGGEGEGRPSLDKCSNQTADVTESIHMDSRIHQKWSKNVRLSHILPSFSYSKNLQKKNKQNNHNYLIQAASSSLSKPLFDTFPLQSQAKELKPSLKTMARLQQSIIFQSKETAKQPHDLLKGYGRLCQSKTVQALILEQFQCIYE